MARARNIKPSFFTNDKLAECEPLARLLFAGLWTIADKEGRLEDLPRKIKILTLPYDDCDCDKLLSQLEEHLFIERYQVENNNYIQIVNFKKHQNPHVKEAASSIPAPDKHHTSTVQNVPYTESPIPLTESPIPHQHTDDVFVRISKQIQERMRGRILNTQRVREWIKAGADDVLILQVIDSVMAKRTDPPSSLMYFEQAVVDAIATKNKPLPVGKAKYETEDEQRKRELLEWANS